MALPGETPRLPVTTELPVFVTVDPASTAKTLDVPRLTNIAAAWVCKGRSRIATAQIGDVFIWVILGVERWWEGGKVRLH